MEEALKCLREIRALETLQEAARDPTALVYRG
jgi:hypothetical protein